MPASSEDRWMELAVALPREVDLHARPAAELVRTAAPFAATVHLVTEQREADAKSLLAILALGARRGTELRLRASGPDAADALSAVAECVTGFRDDHAA